MMRFVLLSLLFLMLVSVEASSSKEDVESAAYFREESSPNSAFLASRSDKESDRSEKKCIEKHHDCTEDRHGCCRSHIFKNVCECFYPEDSSESARAKEFCTCQLPGHLKFIEKGVKAAKSLSKFG